MIASLMIVLVVVVTGFIVKTMVKPKKFPPGPKWYPIIGSINVVQQAAKKYGSQFKGLLELSKEYSTEILGLKLGGEVVVVVYGEKNVRQVFTEKEFEGRPNSFFVELRCLGKKIGLTFADGPLWQEHRRFALTQLRHAGFGKTLMEKEIQQRMLNILGFIEKNNNKPISPNDIVSFAVMNVLWKYVAGEKIEDEKWKLMQELFKKRSKAFSMAGGLLNLMPWCRFLIPEWSGYSLIKNLNRQISDIIEEAIDKHKKKEVEGNDFIYSFMKEMNEDKRTFTEEQLKVICLDLIIAGSQTTGNSLEFALLQIVRNKKIQEKIHEEIDKILGDEIPSWTDSSRLIYTSAFLMETLRYYTIAPLAGPRRVLKDTFIDGYMIPKDTTVLISVGDLHFDPELWDDPHAFKPERFIDERGMLKNSEHMYPFGLGRRRCPGDSLAKSFIFITFVGILQRYRIDCCNGVLPSDEPIIGLISIPKPFTIDFTSRKRK